MKRFKKPCGTLAVWIVAAGCGDFVAPEADATEDVHAAGNTYSCHVDETREDSGIVCVSDEPLPIIITFVVGVASSAIVAIVVHEVGTNPRWLRIAERSCKYTAAQEGWEYFELELKYNAVTGELVEWDCEEVEY